MTIHTMSIGELERVAELVRRDHSSLNTMRLIPDGKYQTRTVTLAEVTREVAERLRDGFRDRARNDFPTLFCAWGKCRVGSTALNNLFGAAGLPSYYQPVKTILRHRLLEAAGEPWRLPYAAEHPHVFSKETAGPYVPAECLFNPLQALLEAGYPADKLRLIVLDREPESSLASWLAKWSDRLPECKLIRNYIVAALNKHRVEAYARRHGIAVTHYVYEAAKDSVQSVQILFARLGLSSRFSAAAVTDWSEIGQLDTDAAKIIYPKEPDVYVVPGLHGADTAYRYRARDTFLLNRAQTGLLDRFRIPDVYRASAQACARDLGLAAATAARLFELDGWEPELVTA
ncbi:MAG: sulfotransferase family protein [Xanthobacteraceae bacterium]|jgi:hypothetical protein